mmetsp:Transcript_47927/g.120960  ORF Transcript_47927/g.120960 Transcript_47927/m.120960 type:complete len:394 (-) Transcript_47927:208-1389(-)
MFIRRLIAAGDEEQGDDGIDPEDSLHDRVYNDISDDKKGDGFSVLSCLHVDVVTYKTHNPDVTEAHIVSDSFGCYSEKFLNHCQPALSHITGVKMLDHAIGEAGMNKSSLDGHFGTAGPHVRVQVAAGASDASHASCMHSGGGMRNTVCREVIISREHQRKFKPSTLSGLPMRLMAYRRFEYAPDGTWLGITFFILGISKFLDLHVETASEQAVSSTGALQPRQASADCNAGEGHSPESGQGPILLTSGKCFTPPVVPFADACMKKGSRAKAKYTQMQLDFLYYAYSRGVAHKGARMTSREAAAVAMKWFGTAHGYVVYGCGLNSMAASAGSNVWTAGGACRCPSVINRDVPHEECLWTPSASGKCKFRARELLEHLPFRTWFSGQKQAFVSK